MARGFCPKCSGFSFAYDPERQTYRCYRADCGLEVRYDRVLPKDTCRLELDSMLGEAIQKIKDNLSFWLQFS